MKVVHIHNEIDNKGGTEVYLMQLQDLLPQYGYQSYWLAIQQISDQWRWCIEGEDWNYSNKQQLIKSVAGWLVNHKIDVVCLHNLFDSKIADIITSQYPTIKFSHSPVVVCPGKDKFWRMSEKACSQPYGLHCFYHAYTEGCTNRHPKRLLAAYTFVGAETSRAKRQYKQTIVMSDYNRNRMLECGIPEDKITVNPYFTAPVEELPVKEQNGTTDLLFIGRILRGKGVEHMIVAVEKLLKSRKNLMLNVVGDGLLLPQIKAMVDEKGLNDVVKFHGWLPRKAIDHYLQTCHLLIFPSTYPESFGIVGIEAMMAGKPVVAFDVGGVSTWLEHGTTGFLCAAGDEQQMGKLIKRLLDEPDLYTVMSTNARSSAIQNYLPHRHMQVLDKIFKEAVAAPLVQKYSQ